MIFKVMSAYSVELIALAAGVFLLVKVAREEAAGRLLAKFWAWFIVVASVLLMIFTTLYAFSYCQAGHFSTCGWGKHHKMGPMMEKRMGPGMGPMMEKGMKGEKKGRPMMHLKMQGPAGQERGKD